MTRKDVRWDDTKRKHPLVKARGGLMLRLRPLRGIWHADYELDGRRITKSLRTRSIAIAQTIAQDMTPEMLAPAVRVERPRHSPETIFLEFIGWATQRLRPRTVEGYRQQVRRFLDALEPQDLAEIQGPDLERYKSGLEGLANLTVDHHMTGLSAFFAFSVRNGYLPTNPAHGLRREGRVKRNSPHYARREDVEAILALDGDWRIPIALAYYAGLRLSELTHLEWGDVNLAERRLTVAPHGTWKPKDHERRSIPICAALAAILTSAYSLQPAACAQVWARGASWKFNKPWRAWLAKHKLPTITPHQLRHAFGTYLAAAGVALRNIQEWMGHASITTTMIYMSYVPGAESGIEALNFTKKEPEVRSQKSE